MTGILLNDSSQADIQRSEVSRNWDNGIGLTDSAAAAIRDNVIKGNPGCGVFVIYGSEGKGEKNQMSGNGVDLCGNVDNSLRNPLIEATEEEIVYPDERFPSLQEAVDALLAGGKLILQDGEYQAGLTIGKDLRIEAAEGAVVSLIGKNSYGAPVLSVVGDAELQLRKLRITGGNWGLSLGSDSTTLIYDSAVADDGDGLYLSGLSQVVISNSVVSDSKDNGIELNDQAELTLQESVIKGNSDWGVMARLISCGSRSDDFNGQVTFQGLNLIEGNNTSSHLNGKGNPGNHPWNRPDVPDGQVCLP